MKTECECDNEIKHINSSEFKDVRENKMFFKIAETYEERKQVYMFWEEMRKISGKIHDDFEKRNDDKYHQMFYKNIKFEKEDISKRPDFFEPIRN